MSIGHDYLNVLYITSVTGLMIIMGNNTYSFIESYMSFILTTFSLHNKIWNLPDRSTIFPKFIYDKEGKLAGPTQILPVRVRGPALILKTALCYGQDEMWLTMQQYEKNVSDNVNDFDNFGVPLFLRLFYSRKNNSTPNLPKS